MIEKVMRAVKSSNKKRGRNITIGAVVGMLLSCISVMGADIIGLDITQGANGEILFNNQKYDKATHSFSNNTFKNNVYTNNMEISGEKDSGEASGIKLSLSDTAISIVNNGKILGNNSASGNNSGNGIDNILGTIENLTNTGTITGSSSGIGTGIINASGIIRNLTNTGIILGSNSSSGYGIYNLGERIENLTNTGIILGSKSGSGIGISNYLGAIENLTNTGMILGSKSGSDNSYGISNVSGTIDNLTNTGMILGSESGSGYSYGIINGSLIENLTNIGMILGSNSDYGTGIYNDTGTIENLTNIGMILGNKSSSGNGYGIGNYSSERIENLTNTGMILGSESSSDNGYGIDNGSLIENLTNIGIITGNKSGYGAGINNVIGTIGNLTNTGKILGSKSDYGTGIYNDTGTIENLTNIGMILGNKSSSGNGYGIGNYSSELIGNLNNLGVIYGKTNAINNNSGTITNGVNYGLLISNNSSGNVVGGDLGIVDEKNKEINKIVNYGLAFNFDGGSYKTKDEYHNNFGTTSKVITIDGKNYTIINVGAVVGDPSGNIREITSWKSLGMKNGELFSDANTTTGSGDITTSSSSKGYILNGIEDTLKVIEKDEKNILNNSIINAYKTAVNIGADSNLTLGNTVINGGADGTSPVIFMAGENSILSIDKNSKINGDISSAGANNEITIKESIINGDITTSENGNTLNLIGNRDEKRVVLYNNTMNIFHNIDGFAKINIGNNVAFYEDSKITDVENVNIQKDGILVLRIDSTDLENGTNKIIGHALYGATSSPTTPISLSNTTISSDGGKLLLTLNGAGNTDIISFGTTKLDGSIKGTEAGLNYQEDFTIDTTSFFHSAEKIGDSEIRIVAQSNLPMFREIYEYDRLNGIYKGIISVDELRNFAVNTPENLSAFLEHLNDIYAGNPYSYSSELSRKSAGMFRDIVVDNNFKPNLNNWLIYGGLTHTDGGNRDTYYGENYYLYDTGSSNIDADTKITGAYMLGEYGVFDSLTAGIIIGGNKLKSNISNGSKVDGSALYLGAYAKKYLGNLKVTGGLGFQYGDYDADRLGVNKVASDSEKSVIKYSDNYNDMTYDIYLNGRYSHQLGDNLFLEPYATLSYTYIKQDGADEGNKTLAIETDSKSFDYTVGKIGVDLKKNISHSNGKSTLSAGVNYTKILDGAEQEFIKGRFKGGSDFDILVAHKNQHSIGLNAKYALELENGLLFDIKGTYSVERDSHNGSGKNKTKGEWIVGTGLGYKF